MEILGTRCSRQAYSRCLLSELSQMGSDSASAELNGTVGSKERQDLNGRPVGGMMCVETVWLGRWWKRERGGEWSFAGVPHLSYTERFCASTYCLWWLNVTNILFCYCFSWLWRCLLIIDESYCLWTIPRWNFLFLDDIYYLWVKSTIPG